MKLHEALIKVREDVGVIGKTEKNTQQNFFYRGIDQILKKVGPALITHGVNVFPELRSLDWRDIVTGKGTRMREVTVTVAYTYVGPEGDERVSVVAGEAADAGDKAVSKAMAVALRISHIQTLQIPTGEQDPDAQTVTRAVDPVLKLKNDIWAEAEKRGWIESDGTYEQLAAEFATWNQGGDIATAEEAVLRQYANHLKPKQRMQRKPAGGGQ